MTTKVKTFFHIFLNSLVPQKHYYQKLTKTKFSFSFKYFVTLMVFLNLIFYSLFFALNNPTRVNSLKQSLVKSLSAFPSDLKIFIQDGTMVTTYDRPYFMWINLPDGEKTLLAVVDENATPDKITEYNSMFLLTHKNLVVNRSKFPSKLSIIPLDNVTTTLDKKWADEMIGLLGGATSRLIAVTVLFALFVAPLLAFLFNIVVLFLASIAVYLIFTAFHHKHKFKKTFQIALHSSTLPLIVFYGLGLFNLSSIRFSASYFVLVLIFFLCGMYEAYFDSIKPPRLRFRP